MLLRATGKRIECGSNDMIRVRMLDPDPTALSYLPFILLAVLALLALGYLYEQARETRDRRRER